MCLLSVCTINGHVKLYYFPHMEFGDEWIEIIVVVLCGYMSVVDFEGCNALIYVSLSFIKH
jgi:hypothetical protein